MPVSISNVRVFNRVAMAMAIQSAKGSPVGTFAEADAAWGYDLSLTEGITKSDFQGTHGSIFERKEGRVNLHKLPIVTVRFHATPTFVSTVIDAFAGGGYSSGVAVWKADLAKYISFAFRDAESGDTSPGQVWRFKDAWIRRILFESAENGILEATMEIWAEDVDRESVSSSAITLVDSPTDFESFTHRSLTLTRDPAGSAVDFVARSFSLDLNISGEQFLGNKETPTLIKEGFLQVRGRITGRYSDEYKAIREDAIANTFKKFKAKYTAVGGSKSLEFALENVIFDNPTIEVRDRKFGDFDGSYWAMFDGAAEPVKIKKTGF